MKNLFKFFCFALVSVILLGGVAGAEESAKSKVIAKVNGKEISEEDVNFFVEPVLSRAISMGQNITPEMKITLFNQWKDQVISRELLLQCATEAKITVSDKEIADGIADAKNMGFPVKDEAKLKLIISDDLMINKIIEDKVVKHINITDDVVKKFYEVEKERIKEPEQVKAKHILIKVEKDATKENKDELLKKTEGILKEAKDGKSDFAELAKKYSEGPSGPNGGELGYFPRGKMVPSFEDAAFLLAAGGISDIVETQFGYHIIKVEEKKKERTIPFEEVEAEIRENLKFQQGNAGISKFIEELKSNAKIEMFD